MTRTIVICIAALATSALSRPVESSRMEQAMMEPRVLLDFAEADSTEWYAINDGVMGGLSQSRMVRSDEGTGIFAGELSLENNGGFASVRAQLGTIDLSGYSGIEVRVRGDGRTYQLRLRMDDGFDGVAYRATFATHEGEWVTRRIPFDEFRASFRGQPVPAAPALDPARMRQLAFMLADKKAGSFRLEIDSVRAW